MHWFPDYDESVNQVFVSDCFQQFAITMFEDMTIQKRASRFRTYAI